MVAKKKSETKKSEAVVMVVVKDRLPLDSGEVKIRDQRFEVDAKTAETYETNGWAERV